MTESWSSDRIAKEKETDKNGLADMFFPRAIKASSRRRDKKVRFVESTAVPASILEELNSGGFDERLLNALSQWRIDYPDRGDSFLDEKTKQVLSVLEKKIGRAHV